MRFLQWLVLRALPQKWARRVEEETKAWIFRCPCGRERSLWEAGGLRFGAAGRAKKVLGRCPACRKFRWMDLVRLPRPTPAKLR